MIGAPEALLVNCVGPRGKKKDHNYHADQNLVTSIHAPANRYKVVLDYIRTIKSKETHNICRYTSKSTNLAQFGPYYTLIIIGYDDLERPTRFYINRFTISFYYLPTFNITVCHKTCHFNSKTLRMLLIQSCYSNFADSVFICLQSHKRKRAEFSKSWSIESRSTNIEHPFFFI